MFSCGLSILLMLVAVTLYVASKNVEKKGNKTMMEVWTLVVGGIAFLFVCVGLSTGI